MAKKKKNNGMSEYESLPREQREKLEYEATKEAPDYGGTKSAIELGQEKYQQLKQSGGLQDYFAEKPANNTTPQTTEPPMAVEKKTTFGPGKTGPQPEGIVTEPMQNQAVTSQAFNNINEQSNKTLLADPENRQGNSFVAPAEDYTSAAFADEQVGNEVDNMQAHSKAITQIATEGDPMEASFQPTTDDITQISDELVQGVFDGNIDLQDAGAAYRNFIKNGVNYKEPAIEKMGLQQYFPEINRPLQVGTYSGSIVGSNPIFSGGAGYFPMGIVDARNRAFENAKKQKIKNKKEIEQMAMALAKGDTPYQDQIDNAVFDLLNQMEEQTGGDFSALDYSTDLGRYFYQEMAQIRNLGQKTLEVGAQIKKIDADMIDKEKYVPAYVQKLSYDWKSGKASLEDLKNDPKKFAEWSRNIRSYSNWSNDIMLQAKQMKLDKGLWSLKEGVNVDEVSKAYDKIDHSNYDEVRTFFANYMDTSRVDQMLNGLINQNDYWMGKNDKEQQKILNEMYNYALAQFPTQVDFKQAIVNHGEGKFYSKLAFDKQQAAKKQGTLWTEKNNQFENKKTDIWKAYNAGKTGNAYSLFAASTGSTYNDQTGKFEIELTGEKQKTYNPYNLSYSYGGTNYTYDQITKMASGETDATPEMKDAAKWIVSQGSVDVNINKANVAPAKYEKGRLVTMSINGMSNMKNPENSNLGVELNGSIAPPKAGKTKYVYKGQSFDNYDAALSSAELTGGDIEDINTIEVTGGQDMPNMPFTITTTVNASDPATRGMLDQDYGASTNISKAYGQGESTMEGAPVYEAPVDNNPPAQESTTEAPAEGGAFDNL